MTDKNPQNAKVGDLIMSPAYTGGTVGFGKIVSFAKDGRPYYKTYQAAYHQDRKLVSTFIPDEKGYMLKKVDGVETRGKVRWDWVDVDINHPARWGHATRATKGWMVIAHGDGRAETTTEEHPIAKARRQFMELEGKKGYAF